jgi:hypothetical protein
MTTTLPLHRWPCQRIYPTNLLSSRCTRTHPCYIQFSCGYSHFLRIQ